MSKSPADLKRDVGLAAAEVSRLAATEADDAWRRYIDAKIEWLKEELIVAEDKNAEAAKIKLLRDMIRDVTMATARHPVRFEEARKRPTPATELTS